MIIIFLLFMIYLYFPLFSFAELMCFVHVNAEIWAEFILRVEFTPACTALHCFSLSAYPALG